LNRLLKQLTNDASTFLEDGESDKTITVKRYVCEDGNIDRIPSLGTMVPLERLHIDRNRDACSKSFRNPMRLTMLISYDSLGGTHFPFAEPLSEMPCPDGVLVSDVGVGSVDKRSLLPAQKHSGKALDQQWPLRCAHTPGRGLFVGGRRGRLLVWASSSIDTCAPLYTSLHQGCSLMKQEQDPCKTVSPHRMVTVIGWDGAAYETSGRHECLDNETFQTRAEYMGRSLEAEVMGVMLTGGPRADEARRLAETLAQQRMTTIERMVHEFRCGEAHVQEEPARQVSERPLVPDQIFWEGTCPVCMGNFLEYPSSAVTVNLLEPGFLRCGHLVCETCFLALGLRLELTDANGFVRCPTCRASSSHHWQSCLATARDGQLDDRNWIVKPEARAPSVGVQELYKDKDEGKEQSNSSDGGWELDIDAELDAELTQWEGGR